MQVSLGLVGLGQFGVAFADMFMNHPLVDRVALCDREPDRMERFARKELWQKKFSRSDMYGSLADILAADLDALVIITQPWLHAEQAVKAMEAGKHVYSAVPVVSLPDGDEILDWCGKIVDTSRRTGMRYMLGETTYYRAPTMFCRRKAAEGLFGDFVPQGHGGSHPYLVHEFVDAIMGGRQSAINAWEAVRYMVGRNGAQVRPARRGAARRPRLRRRARTVTNGHRMASRGAGSTGAEHQPCGPGQQGCRIFPGPALGDALGRTWTQTGS